MNDKPNNPPVHPVYDDPTATGKLNLRSHGKTLRDDFASGLILGLIAREPVGETFSSLRKRELITEAYDMAEQMLREKQRRDEEYLEDTQ